MLLESPLELIGSQTPTHQLVPPDIDFSDIDAVLDIADGLGIELDQYQEDHLTHGLGRRFTGPKSSRWAAYEVAIELSRQNGKSVIFELRSLAGLFVFREKLIVYSAHKGETAMQAYQRMVEYVTSDPELRREVWKTPSANGKEAIVLRTPLSGKRDPLVQVLKFRTRTPDGGRGLTGDCVIIDEAQGATDDHVAALMPALSAMTVTGDPQIWYGGSAGNRKSTVQGRLVSRTEKELQRRAEGQPPRERKLMMTRFAADLDIDDPADPRVWAKVNPAFNRRIAQDYIETEFAGMNAALDPTRFAAERLGVGDYPRAEGEDWVIPRRRFDAALDEKSTAVGPVAFGVEVRMDRSATSITAAGFRSDGDKHLEPVAEEEGVPWAVTELKRLTMTHENIGVVIDPGGPANVLIGPLRAAGVEIVLLKTADVTTAWGKLYDGFMGDRPTIRHRGGLVLTAAVAAAQTRPVQGSITLKRATPENSGALIAGAWAAHALDLAPKPAGVSRVTSATSSDIESAKRRRPRSSGGFNPRTSSF